MLNRVILMGRITQDLEVRQTPNGTPTLQFSIAVDRSYKDQNGQYPTDFINCVAWRQTAEFIGRYFGKGRMIAIEGNLRTRTYDDKNGIKRYVTEVYVDNASFTGERADGGQGSYGGQSNYGGGYSKQNNSYSSGQQTRNNYDPDAAANDSLNIGEVEDFQVLSDDGVPF